MCGGSTYGINVGSSIIIKLSSRLNFMIFLIRGLKNSFPATVPDRYAKNRKTDPFIFGMFFGTRVYGCDCYFIGWNKLNKIRRTNTVRSSLFAKNIKFDLHWFNVKQNLHAGRSFFKARKFVQSCKLDIQLAGRDKNWRFRPFESVLTRNMPVESEMVHFIFILCKRWLLIVFPCGFSLVWEI